jgi:hypothetical protein
MRLSSATSDFQFLQINKGRNKGNCSLTKQAWKTVFLTAPGRVTMTFSGLNAFTTVLSMATAYQWVLKVVDTLGKPHLMDFGSASEIPLLAPL